MVADLGQASSDTPVADAEQGCGVTFVQLDTPYVHAKAIIADGKTTRTSARPTSARRRSTTTASSAASSPDATSVKSVATTVAGDIAGGSSF